MDKKSKSGRSNRFCLKLIANKYYSLFSFYKGSYEQEALEAHNNYRRIHDAPPMRLDSNMNQQAAAYAQRLARMGTLQHSTSSERPGQGENLAMACGSGGLSAKRAVDMW